MKLYALMDNRLILIASCMYYSLKKKENVENCNFQKKARNVWEKRSTYSEPKTHLPSKIRGNPSGRFCVILHKNQQCKNSTLVKT